MQLRLDGHEWQKAVWKIVSNPAIEVMAAIVVMLLAAWVVVATGEENRLPQAPIVFGGK